MWRNVLHVELVGSDVLHTLRIVHRGDLGRGVHRECRGDRREVLDDRDLHRDGVGDQLVNICLVEEVLDHVARDAPGLRHRGHHGELAPLGGLAPQLLLEVVLCLLALLALGLEVRLDSLRLRRGRAEVLLELLQLGLRLLLARQLGAQLALQAGHLILECLGLGAFLTQLALEHLGLGAVATHLSLGAGQFCSLGVQLVLGRGQLGSPGVQLVLGFVDRGVFLAHLGLDRVELLVQRCSSAELLLHLLVLGLDAFQAVRELALLAPLRVELLLQ
mmetsp:Transcript_116461/g.330016  ORF Transcript_116461/g.330016 Transcript_116461/m.330016 type:complete len:275 (-) Transcript_116461:284-1108(-)